MMINPIIALAGLAESMLNLQLRTSNVMLYILPVIFAFTMIRRSRVTGYIGLAVILGAGLLCEPWHVFMQQEYLDPDKTYWAARFRSASTWWFTVAVVGIPAFILMLRRNWNVERDH